MSIKKIGSSLLFALAQKKGGGQESPAKIRRWAAAVKPERDKPEY